MKLNPIAIYSRSVTFEFDNQSICFQDKKYNVYINNELKFTGKKNVFSLFGLKPNSTYTIFVTNGDDEVELTFQTKEEVFILNILDFGAVGDGVFDNTEIIQKAIHCIPKGGTLYFPEGTFLSGPLFLKSDTTMYFSKNSVLLGKTNREEYPIIPAKAVYGSKEYILASWEGTEGASYASLLTGIAVSNVNICGDGTIDCNACNSDWWINHREKRGAWRPNGIYLAHSNNISIQGVMVSNTPSWNQHAFFCEDISYYDMRLVSPLNSPTTDGIDPDCSKNIKIIGVNFCVGDDCIAVKSGKLEIGKKFKTPSSNIVIRNCYMYGGHAGLTLGSEMSGGINDVFISKCYFEGLDRGIRLKTMRGRGKDGIIDGISFKDVYMENVKTPFVINMFYKAGSQPYIEELYSRDPKPVTELTPYLGAFSFENMIANEVEWQAGVFLGLPEAPIKQIKLSNITIKMKEHAEAGMPIMTNESQNVSGLGLAFENVNEVILNDVTMIGCNGEQVITKNVLKFERS